MKVAKSFGKIAEYAGVSFRSNTEATWAMHFDGMGIVWQYEPFILRSGGARYSPDFWLPDLSVFVETKGVGDYEENRFMHLAYTYSESTKPFSGRPLIFCVGRHTESDLSKGRMIRVHLPWADHPLSGIRVATFSDALALAGGGR